MRIFGSRLGKVFFFQQDGAPAHHTKRTTEFIRREFGSNWIGLEGPTIGALLWPPYSPNLSIPDFFLWRQKLHEVRDCIPENDPTTTWSWRGWLPQYYTQSHHICCSKLRRTLKCVVEFLRKTEDNKYRETKCEIFVEKLIQKKLPILRLTKIFCESRLNLANDLLSKYASFF